jgi:hypothetical protein
MIARYGMNKSCSRVLFDANALRCLCGGVASD